MAAVGLVGSWGSYTTSYSYSCHVIRRSVHTWGSSSSHT